MTTLWSSRAQLIISLPLGLSLYFFLEKKSSSLQNSFPKIDFHALNLSSGIVGKSFLSILFNKLQILYMVGKWTLRYKSDFTQIPAK